MSVVSMDEIKKLVGLQLGKRDVGEHDRFLEDLGAESADVANLVATVEERYSVNIKEAEIARLSTSADLYELVKQRTP